MNIAISGANGFIGRNLISCLKQIKHITLITILRNPSDPLKKDANEYSYEDLYNGQLNDNIDLFIHLASPNYDYCKDNSLNEGIFDLTQSILKSLENYNCKKFIFFSSCKVYGESSSSTIVHNELSDLKPVSDYAKAKVKAEDLIIEESTNRGINYLIYRLPFVYGYGMKSNIGKLLKIIDKSLPVVTFRNNQDLKKSFLSTENINRLISYNIDNPDSVNNQIYNISDTEPLSLDAFLKEYKKQSHSRTLIISMPRAIANLFFKTPLLRNPIIKIFGSFEIDNSKIKRDFKDGLLSSSQAIKKLILDKMEQ
tara:strand:+ start:449 stop:1381 length:933 start_codon:yes stop_codon:yes gene_type:complete